MERRRFLLFAGIVTGSVITYKLCNSKSENQDKMEEDKYKELSQEELEHEIRIRLKAGEKLTVEWNCGGDEAILNFLSNDVPLDYEMPITQSLDLYLINLLMLPDVGEFSLEGKGNIYEEDGNIYLECESTMIGSSVYDEEYFDDTGEELDPDNTGWEEMSEEYSGKFELFKKN